MIPNTYYKISHHSFFQKKKKNKKVLSTFFIQSILLNFEAEMNEFKIQTLP